jgi:hypothetical protein
MMRTPTKAMPKANIAIHQFHTLLPAPVSLAAMHRVLPHLA